MIPNKIVERAIATLEHCLAQSAASKASGIGGSYHDLYGPVFDGEQGYFLTQYYEHPIDIGPREYFFDGWELAARARARMEEVYRRRGDYPTYEASCMDAIARIADMESYGPIPGSPW